MKYTLLAVLLVGCAHRPQTQMMVVMNPTTGAFVPLVIATPSQPVEQKESSAVQYVKPNEHRTTCTLVAAHSYDCVVR